MGKGYHLPDLTVIAVFRGERMYFRQCSGEKNGEVLTGEGIERTNLSDKSDRSDLSDESDMPLAAERMGE